MMLGAADVGKTTTATRLVGAAVRAGLGTAVVDADIGQSDIGPPATIGWGIAARPVRRMTDIAPAGLWFVGDTSPRGVYRYVVEGTAVLTATAQRRGARLVVVDTTGWVDGMDAVAAKIRKIRRLAPRHIVAIQRTAEVEPILADVPTGTLVHRLRPAQAARTRTSAERRALREARFSTYFAGARPVVLDTRRLAFARCVLFHNAHVPPAQVLADVPPAALRHLLVGLAGRGRIMAMGTVFRSAPALHRLDIIAPGVAPDEVRSIVWGGLRVAPWGREQGRLSDMAGAAS